MGIKRSKPPRKTASGRPKLAPLAANAEPRNLTIKQGDQTVTKQNVLVGDVWICGGQSNMQWEVHQSAGAQEAVATGKNPNIRLFTVKRTGDQKGPRTELDKDNGAWTEATPESVRTFSAVGYYFGRDLQKDVKVPIGLISSNIGGTTAERWMSKEAIDANSEIKDMRSPQGRNDLYNAMIAPLASVRHQGSNLVSGRIERGPPLQLSPRARRHDQELARHLRPRRFPLLHRRTCPVHSDRERTGRSGMGHGPRIDAMGCQQRSPTSDTVSIVDVGDEKDIHPAKKQPVGERLAIAARAMAYGEKITPAGPEYDSAHFRAAARRSSSSRTLARGWKPKTAS